jgi:hypothetical protein
MTTQTCIYFVQLLSTSDELTRLMSLKHKNLVHYIGINHVIQSTVVKVQVSRLCIRCSTTANVPIISCMTVSSGSFGKYLCSCGCS